MEQEYQNKIQDSRISKLEDEFRTVCSNYNHEIGAVQIDIAEIKANQKILLWFMFAMLGGIIALYFK
jgi:hypothetical protein